MLGSVNANIGPRAGSILSVTHLPGNELDFEDRYLKLFAHSIKLRRGFGFKVFIRL
jgi:hypothetical protein